MKAFNHAINRVKNIPEQNYSGDYKIGFLWQEFIRRFFIFAKSSTIEIKSYIFDIESICQLKLPNEIHQNIEAALSYSAHHTTSFERGILKHYLLWSAMIDQNIPFVLKHYDLYEPVVRIMEAGSIIICREGLNIGSVNFGGGGICRLDWAAKEPIDIDTI